MEIIEVLRGRSFRDTLFGKVRYGQAKLRHKQRPTEVCQVPIVIKEYNRTLVESRRTASGESVGEDAREELRLHSLLSQRPYNSAYNVQTSLTPLVSTGHPHIIHLFDVRKDNQYYYAILEFASLGEFFPLVQAQSFTPQHARHYFRQLLYGLQYMHSLDIAHRDLSLENILLDDQYVLKICDFGVAIECRMGVDSLIRDDRVPVGKVKFYMPPEVFARQQYSPARADVWCAGIILFVMLTKVHPFKYATEADQRFQMVMNGQINDLLSRWNKEPFTDVVLSLINSMLCPMSRRWNITELLDHPFCRESMPMHINAQQDMMTDAPQQHRHHQQPNPAMLTTEHTQQVSSTVSMNSATNMLTSQSPALTLSQAQVPSPTVSFLSINNTMHAYPPTTAQQPASSSSSSSPPGRNVRGPTVTHHPLMQTADNDPSRQSIKHSAQATNSYFR